MLHSRLKHYFGRSSSVLNVTALFLVAALPGRKKKFWFSSSDGSPGDPRGGGVGVSLKSSEMFVRVRCSPVPHLEEQRLLMISWKLRRSMFRRSRWRRSHLPKCLLQFLMASSFLKRILPFRWYSKCRLLRPGLTQCNNQYIKAE